MIVVHHIRQISALLATSLAVCAFSVVVHAAGNGRTVFVPSAVIYPGDMLTAQNLVERQLLVAADNPPVYGEREEDLLGKVARRTLLPNELVPDTAVRTQDLIKRGGTYKLSYESKFLSIVGLGVTLQSGSVGEIINVRNPETGVIIKARIRPDLTLAVDDQ